MRGVGAGPADVLPPGVDGERQKPYAEAFFRSGRKNRPEGLRSTVCNADGSLAPIDPAAPAFFEKPSGLRQPVPARQPRGACFGKPRPPPVPATGRGFSGRHKTASLLKKASRAAWADGRFICLVRDGAARLARPLAQGLPRDLLAPALFRGSDVARTGAEQRAALHQPKPPRTGHPVPAALLRHPGGTLNDRRPVAFRLPVLRIDKNY